MEWCCEGAGREHDPVLVGKVSPGGVRALVKPVFGEGSAVVNVEIHETIEKEGLPLSGAAEGDAMAGRAALARKELQELRQLQAQGKNLAYSIAIVYAALGERDQAFHWLEVAYKSRNGVLILLKTDPTMDPLRNDPDSPNCCAR